MDAKVWKDRYPALFVVAPPGARAKIAEVVKVDATNVELGDPHVRFVTVPGTEGSEAALVVERDTGTTLVVNDVIWNVDHRPGVRGFLMKVAGFTGASPKIPALVARKAIKEKSAFQRQLELWAKLPRLRRILVSHGDMITRDPPKLLRDLAARLAA
jgi:hypothetical protein